MDSCFSYEPNDVRASISLSMPVNYWLLLDLVLLYMLSVGVLNQQFACIICVVFSCFLDLHMGSFFVPIHWQHKPSLCLLFAATFFVYIFLLFSGVWTV